MRHPILRSMIGMFAVSFVAVFSIAEGVAGKKPNIVFVFTDDQGYGDLSAHGNPVLKTPHLDRLRSESVRFTDFHVSPTCAPTRSALFTGRHEFKNGISHTILERERLTLQATTLAQVVQQSGYRTGIFGKWHLGDEEAYRPNRRGFDEMFIHGGGGIGQVYPGSCGDAPGNTYFDPVILHNDRFVKTKGFCTDVFFHQALDWMKSSHDRGERFFAYISTNAPHAPYTAKPEDAALYEGKVPNAGLAHFFGMIHNIDQNVSKLLDSLKSWGIENETLVIFMNDNGSAAGTPVHAAGMRGAKGSPWLGGTRANSFWRWPGTLQPMDCPALTAHIDFFPTVADIVGFPLEAELRKQVEGRSLVPLLQDPNSPWEDRTLFTHVGRWPKLADPAESKYKQTSVRTKRWSLVSATGGKGPKWELFDLEVDYKQENDVASSFPEVVQELNSKFDQWWLDCQPMLVNEKVIGPKLNPFAEKYWAQFGGGPTDKDYEKMDPTRPFPPPANPKKK